MDYPFLRLLLPARALTAHAAPAFHPYAARSFAASSPSPPLKAKVGSAEPGTRTSCMDRKLPCVSRKCVLSSPLLSSPSYPYRVPTLHYLSALSSSAVIRARAAGVMYQYADESSLFLCEMRNVSDRKQ
ncbi:hypothetical protein L227DRAFT_248605 [Lentinus tigrinus ALCF2SS1-6]|uniref:Uncharacterized protein n=1 Tax=Lentinus tigrinus ALCF2SS1-6 TaxID=1328759 RepID=A0A5C2S018_9APHY|nr:hypothetical protein L227DRAFT_248605 [Lentinus tigrinus ALCF2SS1-6]